MKAFFPHLVFTWRKLLFLGLFNSVFSAVIIYANTYKPTLIWPILLFGLNLFSSLIYLLLADSLISTPKWHLKFLKYMLLLTPFLSIPLLFFLWKQKNQTTNSFLNNSKFSLIILGCLLSLFFSLKPTELFYKKEILLGRILPAEIAYIVFSSIEYSRVSALTPYDSISFPSSVKKVLSLRKQWDPSVQVIQGINVTKIFQVLPLGMGWFRGFPVHSFALMQFHFIAYNTVNKTN